LIHQERNVQLLSEWKSATYLTFTSQQDLVRQNEFRRAAREMSAIPSFATARTQLPDPYWAGNQDAIDCWWKVWELAWRNLQPATPENGFIRSYIDTAFNDNLFLWDSVFILFFGRYAARVFDFQATLDNLYARQHADGFICREFRPEPDGDMFYPHDPVSTGPNILAWSEWDYYQNMDDRERLARVFPVLLAYHRWLRTFRTWQDGSYFHCGLASGMDNQPVDATGDSVMIEHRHLSWIDATAQALLSANILCTMAEALERQDDVDPERREAAHLRNLIATHSRNTVDGFYYHWHPRQGHSPIKSVGAYWTLLADAVPTEHVPEFVAWLDEPTAFNRPHRVPTLAYDSPFYAADGDYWRGGVWPPTNYMVLRGLSSTGYDDLAHEIAVNHHENVLEVFRQTGTVWEFYAPEQITPGYLVDGRTGRDDFVGWGGLAPIALLLEYRFGLRPNVPANRLVWDIRELDEFGVRRYPFGRSGLLDLHCAARTAHETPPEVRIDSNCTLELYLRWAGGERMIEVTP
jgi:hypothetical protein